MMLDGNSVRCVVRIKSSVVGEFASYEAAQMYVNTLMENDRRAATIEMTTPDNKQILLG